MKNINQLAASQLSAIECFISYAKKIGKHLEPGYAQGFADGVRALRDDFLDAKVAGELAYELKPESQSQIWRWGVTYCDAMNAYATNADWICNGLLFLLGVWKLWDLLESFGRWVNKAL